MPASVELHTLGRLADPHDNVAIAIQRLEAGTGVRIEGDERYLDYTVLEGHRFAVRTIRAGDPLVSWGMPFGIATEEIPPGSAISNQSMIETLAVRKLDAVLRTEPNFKDQLEPYVLDEATFRAALPVEKYPVSRTFAGYKRKGSRGVGTRNYVVILGTSSRTSSFVRQLATRLQTLARVFPQIDGIVAVAHTEGGSSTEPNNSAEVLRALAGFIVSPNVGAVLAVDYGNEPINNHRLRTFMASNGYPLASVPHSFLSVRTGLSEGLAVGERIVRDWLPLVSSEKRTDEPLSGLRVALQSQRRFGRVFRSFRESPRRGYGP